MIIKKHGTNKILFGSDSPWYSQSKGVEEINSLNISSEEKDMILYKNACKILDIKKA